MKLFKIDNYFYSTKCPQCQDLLKFEIDFNTFTINGECKNDHLIKNMKIDNLNDKCIHQAWCKKIYNYEKKSNLNSKEYNCYNCNKVIICKCNNNDFKEDIDENDINFCVIHNLKYDFFHNNNRINLCQKCYDSISYIKEKNHIYNKVNEYNEKLEEIIKEVEKKKEEINRRYNELNIFLQTLININYRLLRCFNYTIYDNYNYNNFDYLYNIQKTGDLFDKKIYINYLLNGANLDDNNKDDKEKNKAKLELQKNIKDLTINEHFNFINNYNNLKYFKNNIFYYFEEGNDFNNYNNSIQLFEINESSLKHIYTYIIGKFEYENSPNYLVKGDFNHLFLIYNTSKNIVEILKLDENKSLNLENKFYFGKEKSLRNIIENKNGNLVIKEQKCFRIWEKKDDTYSIMKTFDGIVQNLFNINDLIFLSIDLDYIKFFETEKYEIIKSINLPQIESFQRVNNELLVFYRDLMYCFYFVDIKYLEVVQIYNTDFIDILNHNKFFLKMHSYKDEVIIKKYFPENNNFKYLTSIISKAINIFIYDNYILMKSNNYFEFFKINEQI